MKRSILAAATMLCASLLCFAGCTRPEPPAEEPDPEPPALHETVSVNNPVVQEDMADPHVLRWEDSLYIFTTGQKIYRSDDGAAWKQVGTLGLSPKWGTPGAGVWAPDIVKIGDKLAVYYSLSTWGDENPGIGVATADHPEGPWTDHGKLFLSKEVGVENSIDPCVFRGQDGKLYMIWGSFRGCYGAELTDDGLGFYGGVEYARDHKVLISGKPGPWDGSTFEGSYVIYRDGWYYYFGSSGTCCEGLRSTYNVRIGRSKNPLGPYEDSAGRALAGNGNVGDLILGSGGAFVGPGHNSILIDDDGTYYIFYHVWLNDNGEGKGRYFAMSVLTWDEDGWCTVKGRAPSKRVKAPYIAKTEE